MAKKLFEKAGLIQMPPPPAKPAASAPVEPASAASEAARPKTAPGSMMQFMTAQSTAMKEAEGLRERLASFEGAIPARKLDPKAIRPSRWANRHDASFDEAAFRELKAEILASGGNVQAIKVRPIESAGQGVGPSNPPGPEAAQFEIVYGHRRHRACLELGLPVLAIVEPISEQQLFVDMERENRSRKDLSAWEQGMMYARALDAGLYPSNRQLALAIGRDLGDIGKALQLARLPTVVVEAFKSPLDLQYRWAKPLSDAQQKDPDGLVSRAKAVKKRAGELSPNQILGALLGDEVQGVGPSNPPQGITLKVGNKTAGTMAADRDGRVTVRLQSPLDEARRKALAETIERFLAS